MGCVLLLSYIKNVFVLYDDSKTLLNSSLKPKQFSSSLVSLSPSLSLPSPLPPSYVVACEENKNRASFMDM